VELHKGCTGICDHSALRQRTRETARTGVADHSTVDGLRSTGDTPAGGLKPPDLRVMRVRTPPRAPPLAFAVLLGWASAIPCGLGTVGRGRL
jgi:hypothetical protein